MYLFYDVIFLLYALIYLPYLILTKRGYSGFGMRFSFFPPQVKKQIKAEVNIWLHAVSVGEVMVIDVIIDQLKKRYPGYQVVVTVTTKTGYKLALERLVEKAIVMPSPIDFSFVAGRFVALIDPRIYIAVETEIWPNLYRQLYCRNIPIAVINGRISDASFGRYKAVRFLLKGILNQVQVWCMQSQVDAQRIMDLGAEPSHVVMTGNVKFDEPLKPVDPSNWHFKSSKDALWWVAGSTHPGEEDIILDVYDKIIQDDPRWLLVIAPRHVHRTPQITELITRRGLKAIKLSEINNSSSPEKSIIVVDTIGHLRSLYSLASLVFVGKSLCVGGGHNVIEPAKYGKAIIVGPKVENFRDIIACFKEKNAIVQVDDAHAFESAVKALCSDPSKREVLGVEAKKVIAENQGATKRSLERLAEHLK